jgi:hypothetical protein
VRLQGTPYESTSGGDGSFRLDSLPAGTFDVVVEHPDYEALGMPVATGEVALREGDTKRLSLKAADTRAIVSRLCMGRKLDPERAALRVNVRNSATGGPLAFVTLTVTWKEFLGAAAELTAATKELSGTSDSHGGISFCDVPASVPLILNRRLEGDRLAPLDSLRLRPGAVATTGVAVAAPRP